MTLASSIQSSKMQCRKWNHLHNLPALYSIYYMSHAKVVYIANHTTLDLGHQKFAVDIPFACGSGYIYCKLPLTSVSGSIFTISPPCHGLYNVHYVVDAHVQMWSK